MLYSNLAKAFRGGAELGVTRLCIFCSVRDIELLKSFPNLKELTIYCDFMEAARYCDRIKVIFIDDGKNWYKGKVPDFKGIPAYPMYIGKYNYAGEYTITKYNTPLDAFNTMARR